MDAVGRQESRKPGKTDRLDARAMALCVLEDATSLPVVEAEDETTFVGRGERRTVLGFGRGEQTPQLDPGASRSDRPRVPARSTTSRLAQGDPVPCCPTQLPPPPHWRQSVQPRYGGWRSDWRSSCQPGRSARQPMRSWQPTPELHPSKPPQRGNQTPAESGWQ